MKRIDIVSKLENYLKNVGTKTTVLSDSTGIKIKFPDIETLHNLLDGFRCGSNWWDVSLLSKSTLLVTIPKMNLDDLNRDTDYKICILKSVFGK